MIISYKHTFIFVKTRKTAGSSIQAALLPALGDDDIVVGDDMVDGKLVAKNLDQAFSRDPHVPVRQMRLALSDGGWGSMFKFAFVRNPWDLVVSRYHWERRGRQCSPRDFRAWLVS